jgi:hypothetical protein
MLISADAGKHLAILDTEETEKTAEGASST